MTRKDIQEKRGFIGGWNTIAYYRSTDYRTVPEHPGVYAVTQLELDPPKWLAETVVQIYKGRPAAYPVEDLQKRWNPFAQVIYYGQAGGGGARSTLRKRICQYLNWTEGEIGHSGGRAIWQLADVEQCRIAWTVQLDRDPRDLEREVLEGHIERYGRLPFANRRR